MSAVSLSTDVESIQKTQEKKIRAWQIASSVLIVLFLCIASFLCYYGVSESNRLVNDAMVARDASWTQEHVASSLSPVALEKLLEHGDTDSIVENEEQATYDDVKTEWSSRGVTYPVSGNISPEQGSVEFLDMKNGFTPPPSRDDQNAADSNLTADAADNSVISSNSIGAFEQTFNNNSSTVVPYPINELITVKYLMVDASDDTKNLRISDLWEDEALTKKVLGQQETKAEIYALPGIPNYYAVYATPTIENGIGLDIIDALAALDDAKGQAIDGVVYDPRTGIAYIPSSAIENDNSQRMQLQFLQRVDLFDDEQTNAELNVHIISSVLDLSTQVRTEQTISCDAFDTLIDIPVFDKESDAAKAGLSLGRFEVLFGGIPIELNENTAIYDEDNGHLYLGYAPNGVADISVRILPNKGAFESLFDSIIGVEEANAARYVLSEGDISFFYNGATFFDRLSTAQLQEGASYVYTSSMYPGSANLEGSKYGVATGKWFDWGPGNDEFASDLHYGASWNAVRTSSDYWFTIYNSGSAVMVADGPFDKNFGGIDWHVQGNYTALDLCCSHIISAVGYSPHEYGEIFNGPCFMRILRVVNNGTWSYVIFGLQTPNATPIDPTWTKSQAGSGLFKVRIASSPQLTIIKTSNGNSFQGIAKGSPISGARYGIYLDAACTNLIGTTTTNAAGRATVSFYPDTTNYIRELSVPWPHVVDSQIYPITGTFGEKLNLNLSDDTSSVLYLNKAKRPQNGAYKTGELDMGDGLSARANAEITDENNKIAYDVDISTINVGENIDVVSFTIPSEIELDTDSFSSDDEILCSYDDRERRITLSGALRSSNARISFAASIPKGWAQSAASAQLLLIENTNAGIRETLIAPLVPKTMAGAQYTIYVDKNCTIEAGDYNIYSRVSLNGERFLFNTSFSTRGSSTIQSSWYAGKIAYYNWRPLGTNNGYPILTNTSSGLSTSWGSGSSGTFVQNTFANPSDKTQQWDIVRQSGGTVELRPAGILADVPIVMSTWATSWPISRDVEARIIRENAYLDPNTAAYDEWYMTRTTPSATMTVDANGNATWGNQAGQRLEPGYRYYVKETRSPEGYEVDPKVYTFVAGASDKHYLNVTDSYTSIEIRKQTHYPEYSDNDDRYSIEGAIYGIYDKNPSSSLSSPLYTVTTDADGHARVDYVQQGKTYYIKEISPSKGMMLDEQVYEIYASSGTLNVVDVFEDMPVEIHISKESASFVPDVKAYSLEGAVFGIYSSEEDAKAGTNAVESLTTGGDGQCPPITLPMHDYWLRETTAPYGYHLSDEIQKIAAEDFFENTIQSRTFRDVPRDVSIQLKKTADSKTSSEEYFSSLAGAEFAIYNTYADALNKENAIRNVTTCEDGTCDVIADLPPKEYYYVRELSVPIHYLVNNEIFTMHVEDSIEFYQEIYDEGEPVSIDIEKISSDPSVLESNYSLERAVIGVYTSEVDALNRENPVRIVETDENGKCPRIEGLYPRTYWVSEITPPDGFYLYPDPIQVHYTTSSLVSVCFVDDPHYGYLFVSKRSADETATPQTNSSEFSYEGAVFAVYDTKTKADAAEEGDVGDCLFTLTTDSTGNVRSTIPLVPGTYYLREIKAPKGYVVSPATYTIETYEHEDLESGVGNENEEQDSGDNEATYNNNDENTDGNAVTLIENDTNMELLQRSNTGTLSSSLFMTSHANDPVVSSVALSGEKITSVNAVKSYQATNSISQWWCDVPIITANSGLYVEFFGGNHGPVTDDIASIDKMQAATWGNGTTAQWIGLSTGSWSRNGVGWYNEGVGTFDVINRHGGATTWKCTDFYAWDGSGHRKLAEWRWIPRIDIYYNATTGSGTANMSSKWTGAPMALNNASTLSKTGYTCIGWNHDPSSNVALYNVGQVIGAYDWNMYVQQRYLHFREVGVANAYWTTRGYANPKGNTQAFTLYAVWDPNIYNIAFDGNNATSGNVATATGARYDQDLILPSGGFSRLGYRLTGWNTKADGTGAHYDLGQETRNLTTANNVTVTLYAEWEEIPYTISFDGNGATSGEMDDVRYLTELDYQLPASKFEKEGCEFVGWSLTRPYGDVRVIKARFKDEGTVNDFALWNDEETSIENQSVTLYAVWKSTLDIEEDALTVFDPPMKTTLQVMKQHLGNLPDAADVETMFSLEGAQLGIYETEEEATSATPTEPGNPLAVIETDNAGIAYYDDAIVGRTYYIKELKAPTDSNYRIRDDVIVAGPVKENIPTTVSFTEPLDLPNENIPILCIKKTIAGVDESAVSSALGTWDVAGTQFGIYTSLEDAEKDTSPVTYVRANANGEAFCELFPGTYWISERIAAAGFVLDSTPHEIAISADDEQVNLKIENERALVGIGIQKANDNPNLTTGMEDSYSLAGAVFGVYRNRVDASSMQNDITTLTTDEEGKAFIDELYPDTYYIRELSAPNNFHSSDAIYTVSPSIGETALVEVKNSPDVAQITVNKTSDANIEEHNNLSLAGAEFGIYITREAAETKDVTGEIAHLSTNTSGITPSVNVVPGTYFVRELRAPAGHMMNDAIFEVNAASGSSVSVEVEDHAPFGTLSLVKTSNHPEWLDNDLSGAVFAVFEDSELTCQVTRLVTDRNGNARSKEIPPGAYYVKETTALAGHAIDDNVYEVMVEDGKDTAVNSEPIRNDTSSLSIQKSSNSTFYIDLLLSDAVYGLYKTPSCSQDSRVAKLVTDENGRSSDTRGIVPGTYYLREEVAPVGWKLDSTIHEIKLDASSSPLVFPVSEEPAYAEVDLSINKINSELGTFDKQGTISVENAIFKISYYIESVSSQSALKGLVPERTWNVATDSTGQVKLTQEALLAGSDELYTNADGEVIFPVGTLLIEEIASPDGMLVGVAGLDDDSLATSKLYHVQDDMVFSDTGESFSGEISAFVADSPKRGDVRFKKVDEEGNPLANIPFVLSLLDEAGNTIESHLIATDENGVFDSSYAGIDENAVFNANDELLYYFNDYDDEIVEENLLTALASLLDDVAGTDVEEEQPDGSYYVPAEDVFEAEKTLDITASTHLEVPNMDAYNQESRTWFSGSDHTQGTPNNNAPGALVYGHYRLFEVECDENDAYIFPAPVDFVVSENDALVELEDVVNVKPIVAWTTAHDRTTSTKFGTNMDTHIDDLVQYENLIPGEIYLLSGVVYDTETGKPVMRDDWSPLGTSVKLVPDTPSGQLTMSYDTAGFDMAGKTVSIYIKMENDYKTKSNHNLELLDLNETIRFPFIATNAHDGKTGRSYGCATDSETVKIIDTVHYENLEKGATYSLQSTLHKSSVIEEEDTEGNMILKLADAGAVEVSGETYMVTTEFTASDESGNQEIVLEVPSDAIAGLERVTVYEVLMNSDGITVADHTDIADEEQTIYYPQMNTVASDGMLGGHIGALVGEGDKDVSSIIDKIEWTPVSGTGDLTMKGWLSYAGSGEAVNDSDGNMIYVEKKLDEGMSSTSMSFDDIPSSAVQGRDVVVFEELYDDAGHLVASHTDPGSGAQTVAFLNMNTEAVDGVTGMHIGYSGDSDSTISIVDKVMFANVPADSNASAGAVIEVVGELYDVDTGKAISDESGIPIAAHTDMTLEELSNGKPLENIFSIPASIVQGRRIVVFEKAYLNGVLVAEHEDLHDNSQTVSYPSITTEAGGYDVNELDSDGNPSDAGHKTPGNRQAVLYDIVSYQSLSGYVGEYLIKSYFVDKETGEELRDRFNKPIRMESRSQISDNDGSFMLTFPEFDLVSLIGKDIVAYEEIYAVDDAGTEYLVAKHTDIDDENQTLHILNATDLIAMPESGMNGVLWGVFIGAFAFVALSIGLWNGRRTRTNKQTTR